MNLDLHVDGGKLYTLHYNLVNSTAKTTSTDCSMLGFNSMWIGNPARKSEIKKSMVSSITDKC